MYNWYNLIKILFTRASASASLLQRKLSRCDVTICMPISGVSADVVLSDFILNVRVSVITIKNRTKDRMGALMLSTYSNKNSELLNGHSIMYYPSLGLKITLQGFDFSFYYQ